MDGDELDPRIAAHGGVGIVARKIVCELLECPDISPASNAIHRKANDNQRGRGGIEVAVKLSQCVDRVHVFQSGRMLPAEQGR